MSQPTILVNNSKTISNVSASTSSLSNGNTKLPDANDTHSSAQTEVSASWGDWFMGILHSVLGWLCFCCPEKEGVKPDKKAEEPVKLLAAALEDPKLEEFYQFVMKGTDSSDSKAFKTEQVNKFKELSQTTQDQIINYAEMVRMASKADNNAGAFWPSPFLRTSGEKTIPSEMRLPLMWMAHKAEMKSFYENCLKDDNVFSGKLLEGYNAISMDGKRFITEISKSLSLDFAISKITKKIFLITDNEIAILQEFFKFLVREEYDASILADNQIKIPTGKDLFLECMDSVRNEKSHT